MSDIQQQEERDYFPQSEFQNVYQQSQIQAMGKPNGEAEIKALTDQGKWVLAYFMARMCPHTDALLGGRDFSVVESFDSEEQLAEFCKAKEASDPDYFSGDADCGFQVFGPTTPEALAEKASQQAPPPPVKFDDGDIPF